MNPKQIIGLILGVLVVLLVASTGVFTEIIKGFSSAMGVYGLIIGILIVLILVFGLLGFGGRKI